jgi:CHASE3 domain sensor protein
VILGAAIAGGVSLWQVQLITAREREARQALREQERKDTHDAFQRDAIIALHDAITAYWQTAVVAHSQVRDWRTEAGQKIVDLQAIFLPVRAAYSRVTAARAKVFDDELRRLVKDFSLQIDVAVSMDVQQAQGALTECYDLLGQIEDRINALLRQLF